MPFTTWLRVARASFLVAVAVPVIFGATLGWRESGRFDGSRFLLTLVGALLVHAGANLMNEHADHLSGADGAVAQRTPVSGGSGVIQEGLLSSRAVLGASLLCLAGGVAVGLYLNALAHGHVILLLGVIGLFLAWAYSERPLALGYRGFGVGELSVGMAFGPLPVVGAYYIQAEEASLSAVVASIPLAALIAAVLLVNGFPDFASDRSVGKGTLVVTAGRGCAIVVYHVLVAGAYAVTALLVLARVLPPACLVCLVSLPLAWLAASNLRRGPEELATLTRAGGATIALHGVFGALLTAGLLFDGLS